MVSKTERTERFPGTLRSNLGFILHLLGKSWNRTYHGPSVWDQRVAWSGPDWRHLTETQDARREGSRDTWGECDGLATSRCFLHQCRMSCNTGRKQAHDRHGSACVSHVSSMSLDRCQLVMSWCQSQLQRCESGTLMLNLFHFFFFLFSDHKGNDQHF